MPRYDTAPLADAGAPDGAVDSLDALIDLQTLSVDTLQGFEKMVEKAEPEFRTVAERFAALHTRHCARLENIVREMGGKPDTDGSLMGTVNLAVITLRSVFNAIDVGAMTRIRSGEGFVLAAFDRALAASLPQGHVQALEQMKAELSSLLDETRSLA